MLEICFKPLERFNRWVILLFCVSVLLFSAQGNAQTAGTGNIQGVVTDGTSAVTLDGCGRTTKIINGIC